MSRSQIQSDYLNTPRQLTNSDGQVVWQWDGEAFGNTPPNLNPSGLGNLTFNLRFPGQYYDAETNLHYNYHRDYDPSTGRYVESDPLGLFGGQISTFAYAEDSPLDESDPSGLDTYTCRRPLKGLGGIEIDDFHLYHEYTCVGDPGTGQMTCGGIGPSGSARGSPSVLEPDTYNPQLCTLRKKKDDCVESCIKKQMAGPLPWYDVLAGTKLGAKGAQQCQIFAENTLSNCISQCSKNYDNDDFPTFGKK